MSVKRMILAGAAAAAATMTPAQAQSTDPTSPNSSVAPAPDRVLRDSDQLRITESANGDTIWIDGKTQGVTREFARDLSYVAVRQDDGSPKGLLMRDYSFNPDGSMTKRDWTESALPEGAFSRYNYYPFQGHVEYNVATLRDSTGRLVADHATVTIFKVNGKGEEVQQGKPKRVSWEVGQGLLDEALAIREKSANLLPDLKKLESEADKARAAAAKSRSAARRMHHTP